jgi:hypothetical protein
MTDNNLLSIGNSRTALINQGQIRGSFIIKNSMFTFNQLGEASLIPFKTSNKMVAYIIKDCVFRDEKVGSGSYIAANFAE